MLKKVFFLAAPFLCMIVLLQSALGNTSALSLSPTFNRVSQLSYDSETLLDDIDIFLDVAGELSKVDLPNFQDNVHFANVRANGSDPDVIDYVIGFFTWVFEWGVAMLWSNTIVVSNTFNLLVALLDLFTVEVRFASEMLHILFALIRGTS